MTYKELYLKEHPECEDIDKVIARSCPEDVLDIPKMPCPYDSIIYRGEEDGKCEQCWDREIPEDIMDKVFAKAFEPDHILEPKTLTKEDIRKLGLGLTPVIKDIEVKPEVEIDGVKVQSTEHGTSIVPVYYACPHYDMVSKTCGDHMDHEHCVCGGDMLICDFFPVKREKAKEIVNSVDKAVNGSIKDSGSRRETSFTFIGNVF